MSPDYTDRIRSSLLKLLVWLCVLLGVFIAGQFVLHFVSSGELTITTGTNTGSITVLSNPIQQGPQRGTIATTKRGTGTLSVRLQSGTYLVSVQDNDGSKVSKSVAIGWLSSKTVAFTTPKATAAGPVLYAAAKNIAANDEHMSYLNSTSGAIDYINTLNQKLQITGDQKFTSVSWADPDYGVAQDEASKLYVINGNTVHPLQSPVSFSNGLSNAVVSVTPNHTIYIGAGLYVYRGTENGGFQKIYADFSQIDGLVATDDRVVILNPDTYGQKGTATIVGTDDQITTKNFGHALSGWTPWSPNGKYIVISVGTTPELFDASLREVGTIPQPSAIDNGSWLNDNTLFYYSGNRIWSYDLSQKNLSSMTALSSQQLVQGISVSSGGAYAYVAVSSSDNLTPNSIFRVSLRGQQVPQFMLTLGDVLPISEPTYTVGLRAFAGTPSIVVTALPGSDPGTALQAAEPTLQGIVGSNAVNFEAEQGD